MSTVNPTYLISYDLPIEATQADYDLLTRIFDTATVNGECWEAAGHRNKVSGYVQLYPGSNVYRIRYVHRLVCHLYHGLPLDHTTHECHHLCRNKACCRPSHLTAVSIAEHKAQTHADGCHPHGDQASWSVLTEAQVIAYRQRYADGETCHVLANEAGITRGAMRSALIGETYEHVPGAVKGLPPRRDWSGDKNGWATDKVRDSDVPTIYRDFWEHGLTLKEIASRYGCTDECIRVIVHNVTRKHVPRPVVTCNRIKVGDRHYQIIKKTAA